MKSVRLPSGVSLRIDQAKVKDYLLDLDHVDGHAKAVFFLKFGFRQNDWKTLAAALRKHGLTQPVIARKQSAHGQKFEVRCNLPSPDGRNPCVTSVWIQEGVGDLRLITVLPRGG